MASDARAFSEHVGERVLWVLVCARGGRGPGETGVGAAGTARCPRKPAPGPTDGAAAGRAPRRLGSTCGVGVRREGVMGAIRREGRFQARKTAHCPGVTVTAAVHCYTCVSVSLQVTQIPVSSMYSRVLQLLKLLWNSKTVNLVSY